MPDCARIFALDDVQTPQVVLFSRDLAHAADFYSALGFIQALLRADLDVDPALLAAIHALNETEQQLLALIALEDYPLRAAAAALGLTEQAARSRWQRIRRRLAQHHTPDSLALATEH